MQKAFRPAPIEALAAWIFRDLDEGPTVLGLPVESLRVPPAALQARIHGHVLGAPLGVAAGPHTQLAQNIVAAWLAGARFMELKTVQVNDAIDVARPCIDAADEAYNCEWSQELTVGESLREYVNAWVLIHALADRLGLPSPGVVFNMSVGYDLAGIKGEKIVGFLDGLRDARAMIEEARAALRPYHAAVATLDIPARVSDHVTLSTMHGCPPREIERIARHLLSEVGVHTWVKLNPTLLGPETLRRLLNEKMGWPVEVPDSAFEHDPRFDDALEMLRSLKAAAESGPACFGIKLSNTLEVRNLRQVLPAAEKMSYLSGRALHPLTLTLARKLRDAIALPMSFCGGADAESFPELVADGLGPVTVCTDLLKPGGYARLGGYLARLEDSMARLGAFTLDDFVARPRDGSPGGATENLRRHAERVADDRRYAARERPLESKGTRPLGWFDCISAPCQDACPAHQDVPEYLRSLACGDARGALDVILHANALPNTTGSVCDHRCTDRCVRQHLDGPLAIRELKRFAAESGDGTPAESTPWRAQRVAIVGAGPAGLAAAWGLASAGFPVTLFEARRELGGLPASVIPSYRLSTESLGADLARITALGVELRLGVRVGRDVSLRALRDEHAYVLLTVGAALGKRLGIEGEDAPGVLDSLDFLSRARDGGEARLGREVAIVGGGSSALDAARTARRLVGDGRVTIVYRRTRAEMPAELEEVRAALAEGIELRELLAPERVVVEAGRVVGLACTPMTLGERDASGRRRPVPSGAPSILVPCDTIVRAVSQSPVLDGFEGENLHRHRDGRLAVDDATGETSVGGLYAGGDVARGPATVIEAIADGRRVARAICALHGAVMSPAPTVAEPRERGSLLARKSARSEPLRAPELGVEARSGFAEVIGTFAPQAAIDEAQRCLSCDELCSLCVTVCPNRACQTYETTPHRLELPRLLYDGAALEPVGEGVFELGQRYQTVVLADFCNACGNCVTFCPTAGAPHRDKPRFWLSREGFEGASGVAFHFRRDGEALRLQARIDGEHHALCVDWEGARYEGPKLRARFAAERWSLVEATPGPMLRVGEEADFEICGALIGLLDAARALPSSPI